MYWTVVLPITWVPLPILNNSISTPVAVLPCSVPVKVPLELLAPTYRLAHAATRLNTLPAPFRAPMRVELPLTSKNAPRWPR